MLSRCENCDGDNQCPPCKAGDNEFSKWKSKVDAIHIQLIWEFGDIVDAPPHNAPQFHIAFCMDCVKPVSISWHLRCDGHWTCTCGAKLTIFKKSNNYWGLREEAVRKVIDDSSV